MASEKVHWQVSMEGGVACKHGGIVPRHWDKTMEMSKVTCKVCLDTYSISRNAVRSLQYHIMDLERELARRIEDCDCQFGESFYRAVEAKIPASEGGTGPC